MPTCLNRKCTRAILLILALLVFLRPAPAPARAEGVFSIETLRAYPQMFRISEEPELDTATVDSVLDEQARVFTHPFTVPGRESTFRTFVTVSSVSAPEPAAQVVTGITFRAEKPHHIRSVSLKLEGKDYLFENAAGENAAEAADEAGAEQLYLVFGEANMDAFLAMGNVVANYLKDTSRAPELKMILHGDEDIEVTLPASFWNDFGTAVLAFMLNEGSLEKYARISSSGENEPAATLPPSDGKFIEVDITGGSVGFSGLDPDCTCSVADDYTRLIAYMPVKDVPPFNGYSYFSWETPLSLIGNTGLEYAVYASLEFVSGEEKLMGALQVKEGETAVVDADGNRRTEKRVLFASDAERYVPGEAVFHIRVAGETLLFEKDITLTILPWDEKHPAIRLRENPTVTVRAGGQITRPMSAEAIAEFDFAAVQEALDRRGEDRKATYDTVAVNVSEQIEKAAEKGGLERDRVTAGRKAGNFCLKALKTGEYTYTVSFRYFGIAFSRECTARVVTYGPEGPAEAWAGETVQYTAADDEAGSGRTFTFSAEGDGVSIDSETGLLTITPEVTDGTPYRVTVTPSDGGPATSLACYVKALATEKIRSEPFELGEGFTVPVFAERNRFTLEKDSGQAAYYICSDMIAEDLPYTTQLEFLLQGPIQAVETERAVALSTYKWYVDGYYGDGYEYQEYQIDGHPAWLVTMNTARTHSGMVVYARNLHCVAMALSYLPRGSDTADWPEVTFNDLLPLADRITYDPSKAGITEAMFECTLGTKEGTTVVAAGKQLHFTATYVNDKTVKKLIQQSAVPLRWYVYRADDGGEVEGITISDKGVLTVSKKITEPYEMRVQIFHSTYYLTKSVDILVTPAVTKLSAELKELIFETASDAPLTVTASWEPATIPAAAFTWKASKEGFVEIVPAEDGSVTVRPLKKGRISLTVTGPGGRKATVNINIKND